MSGTVTIGKVRLADEFLSHQIDSIEAEQAAMSARVTTVEGEVAVVKSNTEASATTAVSDRVTTVEQDVTAVEQDISVVSTRVTAVEQDIGALEQADSSVSTRVTAVEQDVEALESKDVTLASATTAVSNRVTATEQNLVNIGDFISTDSNNRTTITGNDGIYFNRNGETPIYLTESGGLSVTMASTNTYLNYIGTGRNYFCCDSDESTEFRTGSTKRAHVDANGFHVGSTNVGTKLTELEAATTALQQTHWSYIESIWNRLAEIETHYVDLCSNTVKIRNHVAGKYLDQGGTLTATSTSVNAHYSIERD